MCLIQGVFQHSVHIFHWNKTDSYSLLTDL